MALPSNILDTLVKDKDGRVGLTFDTDRRGNQVGQGFVTQETRNAQGNVIGTRQFAANDFYNRNDPAFTPSREPSGRAPIQSNTVTGANTGGTMTREESQADLIRSAAAGGRLDGIRNSKGELVTAPTDGSLTGQDKLAKDRFIASGGRADELGPIGGALADLRASGNLFGSQFEQQTDDQLLEQFGFTSSAPPRNGTAADYANWRANEAEKKLKAQQALVKATTNDVKERFRISQNIAYKEKIAKGISDFEREAREPDSESSKVRTQEMADIEREKNRAFAVIDEDLKGASDEERKIFSAARKKVAQKKFDDAQRKINENFKKNVETESKNNLNNLKIELKNLEGLTEGERLKVQREADIQKTTQEIMENWAVENPDVPLEEWQARRMAIDEVDADPKDLKATKELGDLRARGVFEGGLAGQEVQTAFDAFGGDLLKAKEYWKGKLLTKDIEKQVKEIEASKGFGPETQDKNWKRSEIINLLETSKYETDGTNSAEDAQSVEDAANATLELETIKENEPRDYLVSAKIAKERALGNKITVEDILEWEGQASALANQKKEDKEMDIISKLKRSDPTLLAMYESIWDIVGPDIKDVTDIDPKSAAFSNKEDENVFAISTNALGQPSLPKDFRTFLFAKVQERDGEISDESKIDIDIDAERDAAKTAKETDAEFFKQRDEQLGDAAGPIIPENGKTREIERPRSTGNIANDLNNPGNLTAGGVGDEFSIGFTKIVPSDGNERSFLVFETPQAGTAAMIEDIKAKQNGGSTRISQDASLEEFIQVWTAGASKGYKDTVVKVTGVELDTKFADVDAAKLAEGISKAEGFDITKSIPIKKKSVTAEDIDNMTLEQFNEYEKSLK